MGAKPNAQSSKQRLIAINLKTGLLLSWQPQNQLL
jgi:hypothetical protein